MSEYVYEWYYVDPKSVERGPFSFEQMQNWFQKGYFKPELQARPANSSILVSLEELIKRNGSKTPFVQKTAWTTNALKPREIFKNEENQLQHENQLLLIINKLIELDKRHDENIREIRQVLQKQNERIAGLQIEWAVFKKRFEQHIDNSECQNQHDKKTIKNAGETKKEEKSNWYEDDDEISNGMTMNTNENTNNEYARKYPKINGDNENHVSDEEFSEDEEKSSGFEDTRTENSTPNTVTTENQTKYKVLATKSFGSDGISYYLNLKLSDTNDMFVTAHMFRPKSNIKREFTMKIDAVEQMYEIFDELTTVIIKSTEITDTTYKTQTLMEFLPKEAKQKLNLASETYASVAQGYDEDCGIKFERKFKNFHWEYTIKTCKKGMFENNTVVINCKHIKKNQTSIELSYGGAIEFNETLKEILQSIDDAKKKLSTTSKTKNK